LACAGGNQAFLIHIKQFADAPNTPSAEQHPKARMALSVSQAPALLQILVAAEKIDSRQSS
jgi:hypothetical protein